MKRPLAAGLAALVLVAGCTPAPQPVAGGTKAPRTAAAAPEPGDPDPAPAPSKSIPAPTPGTEPGRGDDLATCLLGTWETELEDLAAGFAIDFQGAGEIVSTTTTGRGLVTYDGDRVTWTYEDLVLEYEFAPDEYGPYSLRLTMAGSEDARYAVTGDEILVDDWRDIDTVTGMVMIADGIETDLLEGTDPEAVLADMPDRLMSATCAADELVQTVVSVGGRPVPAGIPATRATRE